MIQDIEDSKTKLPNWQSASMEDRVAYLVTQWPSQLVIGYDFELGKRQQESLTKSSRRGGPLAVTDEDAVRTFKNFIFLFLIC